MRIDVALLPGPQFGREGSVCVVVDVLRASSSIVTLLERGAPRVVAAANTEEARLLRWRLPDHLLCGEEAGLPPAGFDYGNSPSEFSRLDLAGKPVILATANGTRVLAGLMAAPVVLVGCLLNRAAVAEAAARIAGERGLDITIVCSAAHDGSAFVLEDALAAGAIVDAALRLNDPPEPDDTARFTRDAFSVASGGLAAAVASAYHARELVEAGLGEDVAYCARLDVSSIAPVAERGEEGEPVLRNYALSLSS